MLDRNHRSTSIHPIASTKITAEATTAGPITELPSESGKSH